MASVLSATSRRSCEILLHHDIPWHGGDTAASKWRKRGRYVCSFGDALPKPQQVIARCSLLALGTTYSFFPTCQVRVVRFYVSCLLLLLLLLLLSSSPLLSSPPLLSSSSSCSTATLDAQCSLSDLNHDHPRPVFPAGPQPRPSPPSVPCRTSTTTIHAQCSLPDLNREYPRQKICHIECQKICQIEC